MQINNAYVYNITIIFIYGHSITIIFIVSMHLKFTTQHVHKIAAKLKSLSIYRTKHQLARCHLPPFGAK